MWGCGQVFTSATSHTLAAPSFPTRDVLVSSPQPFWTGQGLNYGLLVSVQPGGGRCPGRPSGWCSRLITLARLSPRSVPDVPAVLQGVRAAELPQEVPGAGGGKLASGGGVPGGRTLTCCCFSSGKPGWRSCVFWRSSWIECHQESKDGTRVTPPTSRYVPFKGSGPSRCPRWQQRALHLLTGTRISGSPFK